MSRSNGRLVLTIINKKFAQQYQFILKPHSQQFVSLKHEDDKIIAFEKGDLLFVFNFHPCKSFEDYRIGTQWEGNHLLLLDTDEHQYGGHDRLLKAHTMKFRAHKEPWNDRPNYIQLYIPSRTAMVLISEANVSKYNLVLPEYVIEDLVCSGDDEPYVKVDNDKADAQPAQDVIDYSIDDVNKMVEEEKQQLVESMNAVINQYDNRADSKNKSDLQEDFINQQIGQLTNQVITETNNDLLIKLG